MHKHKIGIALLASIAAGLFYLAPAHAANQAATINVNTAGTATTLPVLREKMSDNLVLDVNNNLASPVFLEVPDVGVRYMVNATSDQTFFFNLAELPNPQTAFMIKDANGNILSSGQIALTDYPNLDIAALDSLINYNTAYNSETKAQPVYYSKPGNKKTYVRGYW